MPEVILRPIRNQFRCCYCTDIADGCMVISLNANESMEFCSTCVSKHIKLPSNYDGISAVTLSFDRSIFTQSLFPILVRKTANEYFTSEPDMCFVCHEMIRSCDSVFEVNEFKPEFHKEAVAHEECCMVKQVFASQMPIGVNKKLMMFTSEAGAADWLSVLLNRPHALFNTIPELQRQALNGARIDEIIEDEIADSEEAENMYELLDAAGAEWIAPEANPRNMTWRNSRRHTEEYYDRMAAREHYDRMAASQQPAAVFRQLKEPVVYCTECSEEITENTIVAFHGNRFHSKCFEACVNKITKGNLNVEPVPDSNEIHFTEDGQLVIQEGI